MDTTALTAAIQALGRYGLRMPAEIRAMPRLDGSARHPGLPVVWLAGPERPVAPSDMVEVHRSLGVDLTAERRQAFAAAVGTGYEAVHPYLRTSDLTPGQRIGFERASLGWWAPANQVPLHDRMTSEDESRIVAAWPLLRTMHAALAHADPPPRIRALLRQQADETAMDGIMAGLIETNGVAMLLHDDVRWLWDAVGPARRAHASFVLAFQGCRDQRVLDALGEPSHA